MLSTEVIPTQQQNSMQIKLFIIIIISFFIWLYRVSIYSLVTPIDGVLVTVPLKRVSCKMELTANQSQMIFFYNILCEFRLKI